MKYQAVIFDLDGVLCYSDQYHYRAWKRMADEEGIYFDSKINERLRGVSRMESLNIILEKAQKQYLDSEKELLAARKNKYYVEMLDEISNENMADQAIETLKSLRNAGLRTAIGSSSKNARLIMRKLGFDPYFDVVSDGNSIACSKPAPEVFVRAAEMLKLSPAECLVVEDAAAGIEAAYRGGFSSVAIGDAQNHPHATYKISNLSDLISIVTE